MMENDRDWADSVIRKIRDKMEWSSEKNRNKIPYTTDCNGEYDDRSDDSVVWNMDDGLNWWTNGFWGGTMWLMYQDTGDARYQEIARNSESKLERCLDIYEGLHHDVGFMFQLTSVADYRLTKNDRSRKTAMHAASLLAGRFNPAGRFLRAWNDGGGEDNRGWAIIDSMMNLSLLYWASETSCDPRFKQIAMLHADTAMEHFIRPDGSVNHIVEFNPETGEKMRDIGGQGYAQGSSWSRGQGWALYGFMISYIHTKKKEYLDTAKKVAHYCIANIPDDGIVPVDFRQPAVPAWEDSCGAVIIADGLIELVKHVPELEKGMYLKAAMKILKAIDETRAVWGKDSDGVVMNCSAAYHDKVHHIAMVYADYFFIEAVYKLADKGMLLW